jgi:ribonuclease T2
MEEKMRRLIPVPLFVPVLVIHVLAALAAALMPAPARAEGDPPGDFDYYVMALGWSPTYCALQGDREAEDQCHPRHDYSFTLHGLWPQYEKGWPANCPTIERNPTRSDTRAMIDIMGSDGLAWYQWQKHGRCSGLSARNYLAHSRVAYNRVAIPQVFRDLTKDVTLPASVVEDAFVEANPTLPRDGITVTCDEGRIDEVRICMTKELDFRACAPDTRRDCRTLNALMEAVR